MSVPVAGGDGVGVGWRQERQDADGTDPGGILHVSEALPYPVVRPELLAWRGGDAAASGGGLIVVRMRCELLS